MTADLLIVGAGPAGAIAGLVAARAGARVRILDRAVFPRDKLCGDTINPGALAILARLGVGDEIDARGLPVRGMIVTGENGARVTGRYPKGVVGRAILRRDLDAILLRAAVAAGCVFDEGVTVRGALVDGRRRAVSGVVVSTREGDRPLRAPVVVGADGRRSRLAFGLNLAHHPARPRRWAIGGHFCLRQGTTGLSAMSPSPRVPQSPAPFRCAPDSPAVFGEMHVRRGCYVGVAPVPGGLTNVCLVRPAVAGDAAFRAPAALLERTIASDPMLRDRLDGLSLVAPPVVLGPLAVDAGGAHVDGLLLAGDAAGFIDPMTGDGLRFAFQGGELAARAALQALEHGWCGVHDGLARARSRAFGRKWRFNRALRALVGSPRTVSAAAAAARMAPAALRALIARAGDCDLAA
jgi:flavin-dependent dehydrogenase